MKLIIDIPDEMYQNVLNDTYCGTLCKELKNGIPLDKIRDEIERMRSKDEGRWIIDGTYLNIDYVLEVIDKYKAEIEPQGRSE